MHRILCQYKTVLQEVQLSEEFNPYFNHLEKHIKILPSFWLADIFILRNAILLDVAIELGCSFISRVQLRTSSTDKSPYIPE
jgi:hypothetical protein